MSERRVDTETESRADILQDRFIAFSVWIIRLCGMLPKNPAGGHVSRQLMRSGTSPAPNYGEARGAESHADFVHKLGIVLKELNETSIWLKVILRSEMIRSECVQEALDECTQLSRIMVTSIRTARTKNARR